MTGKSLLRESPRVDEIWPVTMRLGMSPVAAVVVSVHPPSRCNDVLKR